MYKLPLYILLPLLALVIVFELRASMERNFGLKKIRMRRYDR
jgi:hypothetical protein